MNAYGDVRVCLCLNIYVLLYAGMPCWGSEYEVLHCTINLLSKCAVNYKFDSLKDGEEGMLINKVVEWHFAKSQALGDPTKAGCSDI